MFRPQSRFPVVLCVLFLLSCTSWEVDRHPAGDPEGVEREHWGSINPDRAARLLSRFIQIRTVNPPGGEAEAARWLVELLERRGIETGFIKTPSPPNGPRRAAAIARVRGTGELPPLLLLSHLDVVDAHGIGWHEDPFAGVIRRGHVVGRGALDAKGLTLVHALTLEGLARRPQPLRRDVVMLAVPDEEAGGRNGLGWIVDERPHLIDGVEYVLGEGGSIRDNPSQRPVWSVSVAEKNPCWLELRTRGTPGHSASPTRDAAVPRLVAALERVRTMEFEIRVVPEVARMFRALEPMAAPQDRPAYRDLAGALENDPDFRRRFLRHRSNQALVSTTAAITVLEGGPATNVAPAQARAQIDARLLPGDRCEAFEQRVRQRVDDAGVDQRRLLAIDAGGSPVDTPLFRAIEATARELDPGSLVVPNMSAGSSDAHWLRERGLTVYGFVPRWLRDEDARGVHGPNERISIRNLERGTAALIRLIENFDELDR